MAVTRASSEQAGGSTSRSRTTDADLLDAAVMSSRWSRRGAGDVGGGTDTTSTSSPDSTQGSLAAAAAAAPDDDDDDDDVVMSSSSARNITRHRAQRSVTHHTMTEIRNTSNMVLK